MMSQAGFAQILKELYQDSMLYDSMMSNEQSRFMNVLYKMDLNDKRYGGLWEWLPSPTPWQGVYYGVPMHVTGVDRQSSTVTVSTGYEHEAVMNRKARRALKTQQRRKKPASSS